MLVQDKDLGGAHRIQDALQSRTVRRPVVDTEPANDATTNVHAEPNKRWLTVSALAILGPNGVQWRAGNVKATATA